MIKPTRKKNDYSVLSIKTLKVELAICGVNTDDFLEKSEFVKALEDFKRHEKKSSKSRRETDDSRLVALPEKNVESPQNKSEGKLKKAFENLKHLGRKDDLSPTRSSGSSVEPKSSCSLSLHPKSFSLSLPSRRKDELSSSSTHSRRSVGKKTDPFVPMRVSSFSVSNLPSRKKDDLSTASTHSTSSSGSIFSFAHHKPERPQRRSAGNRPIKNVRRSCSPCGGSSVSSVSMPSSMRSMGSHGSGRREQAPYTTRRSISPCRPASISRFSEPKLRSPPVRASSFGLASASRQNREKRHTMRPSPSQGKGKYPTRTIQRTTSLPIR